MNLGHQQMMMSSLGQGSPSPFQTFVCVKNAGIYFFPECTMPKDTVLPKIAPFCCILMYPPRKMIFCSAFALCRVNKRCFGICGRCSFWLDNWWGGVLFSCSASHRVQLAKMFFSPCRFTDIDPPHRCCGKLPCMSSSESFKMMTNKEMLTLQLAGRYPIIFKHYIPPLGLKIHCVSSAFYVFKYTVLFKCNVDQGIAKSGQSHEIF